MAMMSCIYFCCTIGTDENFYCIIFLANYLNLRLEFQFKDKRKCFDTCRRTIFVLKKPNLSK